MKILFFLNTMREFYTHAYLFTGRKALWCQELSSAEKKANNKAGWVSCTLGYLPKLSLDLQNLWLKTLLNSTTFLRKTIHVQMYLKISVLQRLKKTISRVRFFFMLIEFSKSNCYWFKNMLKILTLVWTLCS